MGTLVVLIILILILMIYVGIFYFTTRSQGFKTAIFQKNIYHQSTKYYQNCKISIFNDQYVMLHNPIIKINLETPRPIELLWILDMVGQHGSNSKLKL